MNTIIIKNLEILKQELVDGTSADLEQLSASILEHATGITVRLASSGTQSGADAGAMTPSRTIRVEAKRYKETTGLSKHELMGKVAEAFQDNPFLEAWLLVTTKIVPERSTSALRKYGIDHGIPIFILDWAGTIPTLAVLCAAIPEQVKIIYGVKAENAAKFLASQFEPNNALIRLRKDFESWSAGWAMTSMLCNEETTKILQNKAESIAFFKQDLAISKPDSGFVKRIETLNQFNNIDSSSDNNCPVIIIGKEGRGKSWVLADWLQSQLENGKVILYCSSSEFKSLRSLKVEDILAHALYKRTGSFDISYWKKRISQLKYIEPSQPLIWLVIDGLNESRTIDWSELFLDAQREIWKPKVRVFASCRTGYYEDNLGQGQAWVNSAITIKVHSFTDSERDRALKIQNVDISKLSLSILKLASVPRICRLVSSMSTQLQGVENITYERLLFEYGKRFDPDARKGLSDKIWGAFLRELASVTQHGLATVKQSQVRQWIDFQESEIVESALSDITDGLLVSDNGYGLIEFNINLVLVANGLALFKKIQLYLQQTDINIVDFVTKELEPLGGVDERPRIIWSALAAAIISDLKDEQIQIVVSALLVEGLASQNMGEDDEHSLLSYTKSLPSGYLEALSKLDRSNKYEEANILACALLKAAEDEHVKSTIIKFATDWIRLVTLDLQHEKDRPEKQQYRTKQFIRWLGFVPDAGPIQVLGEMIIIETEGVHHRLPIFALRLMQVCPLSSSSKFWRRFGVAKLFDNCNSMSDYASWLVKLNRIDYIETCDLLDAESMHLKLESVLVDADNNLANRAAANLLWPVGDDESYIKARKFVPEPDGWEFFKKDNESPNNSIFQLYHNQVENVLKDSLQPIRVLISRAEKCWPNPELKVPSNFISKVAQYSKDFQLSDISSQRSTTSTDIDMEPIFPSLAKISASLVSDFARRKLTELSCRNGLKWAYLAAFKITDLWLIATVHDCEMAMHELGRDDIVDCEEDNIINHARSSLHIMASRHKKPDEYSKNLINEGIESFTSESTYSFLSLSTDECKALLPSLLQEDAPNKHWVFVNILAHTDTPISNKIADYLLNLCKSDLPGLRRLALYVLSTTNNKLFADKFSATGWSWKDVHNDAERIHGSRILITTAPESTLSNILPRIVPSLLPALSYCCSFPDEKKLIAQIITEFLSVKGNEPKHTFDEIIEINPDTFHKSYRVIQLIEANNSINTFKDINTYYENLDKARQVAIKFIESERDKGLPFYNAWISLKHIADIIENVPEVLSLWLSGIDSQSSIFISKVQKASGLYLSLCRYLLENDPESGVKLWQIIDKSTSATHFTYGSGLEERLLMVFEAKNSKQIIELQNEIWDISRTNTDLDLFKVILSAESIKSREWLDAKIKEDLESSRPWRFRRGLLASSLRLNPSLDRDALNRDYNLYKPNEILETETSKLAARAVWQRHWLKKYLTDSSSEEAYSAFILFKEIADSRWLLILDELKNQGIQINDERRRYINMRRSDIDKVVKKFENKLKETYLLEKIINDLWPWWGCGL